MIQGVRPADGRLRRLVLPAPGTPAPVASPNLLLDPSFEDDTINQWTARTLSTISKSTDRALHGARSLKVTSTGAGLFDVHSNNTLTPVEPAATYTFLASIYPTVNRQYLVAVEYLRADRTLITGTNASYLTPTVPAGAWYSLARTFPETPAEATHARFILRSVDGTLNEVFYADQMSYRKGTTAAWSPEP